MAADADAKTVVDNQRSAEVDDGPIDTLDGNDVAQKEHDLLIEVHDHAGPLQRLRVGGFMSPGERSIACQRDQLGLAVGGSWRVLSGYQ